MKHSFSLAAALAACLAAQPVSANDFLNNLAKQAVGTAVQSLANQMTAKPATTPVAPAAARAPYVRAGSTPQRMRLEDGTVFYADYIVDYWSRPDADTRGSTPDTDALGYIRPVSGQWSGVKKQPEYAALQRKLERIIGRVLEQPALVNIRGASLGWIPSFGYESGGPIPASMSLIAYPITLGDKDTQRFPDGTYHTPGEGPVLRITVNNPEEIGSRVSSGSYKGMTVLRYGYMFVIANTERPSHVDDGHGRKVVNPDLLDKSRPRSDIQFMTVYVGAAGPTMSNLTHKRVEPTSNAGRLFGTLYNTDWRAILEEANTIR
ncbi:hypothetical protein LK542_00425 [Massilia sp. IC2-477]|uniref:hypothetical protein n=1 Tax=Massilia sp. IC2-477 TaxID=2887198 RepID=UPI001D0F847C|nr:hypothetical protein [Massilia sp. IC2-477]MCC2954075.1 hypothetical protein [Massilia sp. IC2-477]